MVDLLLASTSPYRRALLERLGVPFRCEAPRVDEASLKDLGLGPVELAGRLARAKALSLADSEPGATILGGDQVVACDGNVYGKPGTREGAVAQLLALSGRSHDLVTAIALWHRGRTVEYVDVTRLTMRGLDRGEIERYVEADRPFDCAGSYKIESRGIVLFERVESGDHTAITGLPLIALTTLLRGLGHLVP